MNELVSIIMPNYNCERFIEETLKSVISQTYTNWELIIVDDCSTDDSILIINRYLNVDNRIKLLTNEKNSGAAASRNLALREAKGKWIAFLDSDDLWRPDKLQRQVAFMEENGYHFSYTNYEQIDEQSERLNCVVTGPKIITKRKMFNYNFIGCLTAMYDSDYIGLIQIPDDIKKRNDYAIWLKASKKSNCFLLNETLASYRRRSGSISNHNKGSLIKYHYRLFRISENMNAVKACYYTFKNIFYGVVKKTKYVKRRNCNL